MLDQFRSHVALRFREQFRHDQSLRFGRIFQNPIRQLCVRLYEFAHEVALLTQKFRA